MAPSGLVSFCIKEGSDIGEIQVIIGRRASEGELYCQKQQKDGSDHNCQLFYAIYGFLVFLSLLDIAFMDLINLLGFYFREFLGIFGSFLFMSLSAGAIGYSLTLIYALLKSLKNIK